MKTSNRERTLQWIVNQYKKGNISFEHKLQRPIGQWNTKMKSLLVHSLLIGFRINPIYIVEENGILYTIDGSQRTSICISYLNNEFALSKDTPNIVIERKENGEPISDVYEIAGKRFKKLDEEVQNTLLACSLDFYTISEYTDNEVREMFRRQNSGKPLNSKLLRISYESEEFGNRVFNLASHTFFDKLLSKAQKKNGEDRDLVVRTLMIIETNKENDFTSFRKKDIDSFVINYADNIPQHRFDDLKIVLDKFDEAFDEIKIPITSIPMILYSGYRIIKDKKSFTKLIDVVKTFLQEYETNKEYKEFVNSGTTDIESVRGRLDWWREKIRII